MRAGLCTTVAAAGAILSFSCSSASKPAGAPAISAIALESNAPNPSTSELKPLWKRRLDGFVTDLSLSRDGTAVLVSTAPNRETESGSRTFLLSWFDSEGHQLWQQQPDAPVRVQGISDDGRMAVVSTYDEKLVAFDPKGRELWSAEALCRPVLLTRSRRIVCFHDDDAEPAVGFDLFGWEGKKSLSFPTVNDALALKVSDDERQFALGLTRGQVIFFGQGLAQGIRALWQKNVTGEILDLDVSSGSKSEVAVLYKPRKAPGLGPFKRRLALFDRRGRLRADVPVTVEVEKAEFAPDRGALILFGNHGSGADLALFSNPEGAAAVPSERWRKREPRTTDAAAQFLVTREGVLLATGGKLQYIGFDGALRWAAPVAAGMGGDEGASVYAMAWSEPNRTLVVATDDGSLGAFRLGGSPGGR